MKGLDYMKTKKLLKNISLFLVVYAFLVCFYLLVSPGIGPHTVGLHMRRFILAAFVCVLPYYLFKKRNFVFSPPRDDNLFIVDNSIPFNRLSHSL